MNKQVTNAMKAVGAGMAVGAVSAAVTNAITGSSWKRSLKKTAKKAGGFLSDMMDNSSFLMK